MTETEQKIKELRDKGFEVIPSYVVLIPISQNAFGEFTVNQAHDKIFGKIFTVKTESDKKY